jgi:hypothetical protein
MRTSILSLDLSKITIDATIRETVILPRKDEPVEQGCPMQMMNLLLGDIAVYLLEVGLLKVNAIVTMELLQSLMPALLANAQPGDEITWVYQIRN